MYSKRGFGRLVTYRIRLLYASYLLPKEETAHPLIFGLCLPLLVGESVSQYVLWGLVPLFALVCFFTEAESNNPIARLMGYKFYEVTTSDGKTYLVMSKCDMLSLNGGLKTTCSKISGILFDDNFLIHVEVK